MEDISGRMEHQISLDHKTLDKIEERPFYVKGYYYNLAGKGYTTRKSYIDIVCNFLDFMKSEGIDINNPNNFSVDNVNMYFNKSKYTNKGGKIKPTSNSILKSRYSCLNGFFKYLVGSGRLEKNPIDHIERASGRDNVKRAYLEPKELQKLIKAIKKDVDTYKDWKPVRDLAMISVLIVTGIRVTAMTELNMNDIRFLYEDSDNDDRVIANAIINVTDKENKYYQMYLTKDVATYLKDWIDTRDAVLKKKQENVNALFISEFGQRITAMRVRQILSGYMVKTFGDEAKHITPHKLRASFANMLITKTKDIYYTQRMMHHASPSTTELYLSPNDDDIAETSSIMSSFLS